MSLAGRTLSLSTRSRAAIQRAAAATKASKKAAGADGRPNHASSDTRYDLMKRILFSEQPRQLPELSDEDMDRHQTILRAQAIYLREASAQRRAERERKFAAMERAYEALEKADPRLYEEACKKEANVTFPRQMRVPTETPPTKLWDTLS
ncbi:hypothetical protein GGI12_003358 [Dipsacomyces acuminosporus]|nr:hypothetical protein GGI12_003358 [Dipsacomyces acuminosporus]